MIGILLGFRTFFNLALFCVLCAGIVFWVYRSLKQNGRVNLVPFIAANVVLLIVGSRLISLETDEVEHLHCAWMVGQGLLPFVDFWQHHSPLEWVLIAPILKLIPPTTFVFEASRLAGAFVFVLIGALGWSITKKVWGRKATLLSYLLLLMSAGILGEYFWLRPDIFMMLFLLAGVLVSLDIPGKNYTPAFFAGASFALAMSFITKQYLVCLLPVILITWERHRRWPLKLLAYGAGIAVGLAPLLWYLVSNHILRDFVYWVLIFNKERMVVSVLFPLAFVCIVIRGGQALIFRYRSNRDMRSFALLAAFALSTISSLTGLAMLNVGYFLACWFVIAAIVGSAVPIWEIAGKASPLRVQAAVTGVLLGLLLLPNIMYARPHYGHTTLFSEDKKAIARIMEYCRGDSCVVLLPFHPVFVRDATRLYSSWQFYFVNNFFSVKDDAIREDIAVQIMTKRPAVVICRYNKRDFILELFQKKLIQAEDYKKLVSLFKENYTVKQIGEDSYYIRNDKL